MSNNSLLLCVKVQTKDMIGPALDWAVAKCLVGNETAKLRVMGPGEFVLLKDGGNPFGPVLPTDFSTNWSQGGPIIDRECIATRHIPKEGWYSEKSGYSGYGDTLLAAAMRCYVTSQLGNEVDIPKELVG